MRWFTLSIFLPVLIVANAYALPVMVDFDYSDGNVPEFFTVPSDYRGVSVADGDAPFPWVQSFYDSGVTFVNVEFADSPFSGDGSALTDTGAAQYGTYTLFWDEPIQVALLDFCQPDDGGGNLVFSVRAGDFDYYSGLDNSNNNLSLFVYSSEAFSHIEIAGYHSAYLDSLIYDSASFPETHDRAALPGTYDRAALPGTQDNGPLPEPATIILLSLGLCAVTGSIRRKTR